MKTRLSILLLLLGLSSCAAPLPRKFIVSAVDTQGQPVLCDVYVGNKKIENPVRSSLDHSVTIDVTFTGADISVSVVPSEENKTSHAPKYFKPQPRKLYPADQIKQLFAVVDNPDF